MGIYVIRRGQKDEKTDKSGNCRSRDDSALVSVGGGSDSGDGNRGPVCQKRGEAERAL